MLKQALMATTLAIAASTSAQAQTVLSQNFDDVTTLTANGWTLLNLSTAGGTTDWFQGNAGVFAAQSGATNSYIAANYNSAPVGGTITDLLISPTFSTATATTVSFYAKADILAPYADTVTYKITNGLGDVLFSSATTTLTGTWTQYTVSLAAQGAGSLARFTLDYAGPADTSNYIGVDTFAVAAVPEPATWMALAGGLAAIGFVVRRRA